LIAESVIYIFSKKNIIYIERFIGTIGIWYKQVLIVVKISYRKKLEILPAVDQVGIKFSGDMATWEKTVFKFLLDEWMKE